MLVSACVKPLGSYMARVLLGEHVWLESILGWLERGLYRCAGVDPDAGMNSKQYIFSVLTFGLIGFLVLYFILLFQAKLPLNPQSFAGMPPELAFNTAISFITNTNWQAYGGESTLSYFSQMAGLTIQNFISAATGIAVACALFRAFARKQVDTLGNAWVDITRATLYILLPLSFVFAIFLVSQGVVQNFSSYKSYEPLQAISDDSKPMIPGGPVASQVAIKMLGSNGGGYFNTNGAYPFENPTPLSNFFQIVSILLIPTAFAYTAGIMLGDRRQGWMLVAAMTLVFVPLTALAVHSELQPTPAFDSKIIDSSAGNMEGKEVRFGAASSALWAAATSATSNGSVNAMHDSFSPLGGMVPLLLIQFGEVIFGGVGSGTYGMLMFVLLTVFIGGLMVGRTPEFLGKKIGAFEMKMASLAIIIPAAVVLVGTAIAVSTEAGRAGVQNPGAQGFSEILYAFSSAANNNGSAFGGLTTNTPFYNIFLGICMFIGRYFVIIPVLAIAGSVVKKNTVPLSAGTLPTHTPLFTVMLVGMVILLGVLTYIPALVLGPVAEHMHMLAGSKP